MVGWLVCAVYSCHCHTYVWFVGLVCWFCAIRELSYIGMICLFFCSAHYSVVFGGLHRCNEVCCVVWPFLFRKTESEHTQAKKLRVRRLRN